MRKVVLFYNKTKPPCVYVCVCVCVCMCKKIIYTQERNFLYTDMQETYDSQTRGLEAFKSINNCLKTHLMCIQEWL